MVRLRTYGRDNGGSAAAPSRTDGEQSNDDATSRDPERERIRNKHPGRGLVVDVHALGKFRRQEIGDTGAIQTPHSHWVKPELSFAGRAEIEVGGGAVDLGTGAVVPHVDLIDVFQLLGLVRLHQLVDQVSDLVVDVCEGNRRAKNAAARDVLREFCSIRLHTVCQFCRIEKFLVLKRAELTLK
jgi:hypothetical protein